MNMTVDPNSSLYTSLKEPFNNLGEEVKTTNSWCIKLTLAALTISGSAFAKTHQTQELGAFLKEFHSDTAAVMDQIPFKVGQDTLSKTATVIPASSIAGNAFVDEKDAQRSKICKLDAVSGLEVCAGDLSGRAAIAANDRAEDLVDRGERIYKHLAEMDKRSLFQGQLAVKPWSDDYWSIAKGVLSHRYADPNKVEGDWKARTDYVRNVHTDTFINSGMINILSPSEKYDLLLGDSNYTLTKKMMNEGKYYYESAGKVEPWMGICHGWAPAAYMLDRATSVVTVKSVNGIDIPFYPSDIKSLATLLWANVPVYTKFSGGRCNTKEPKKDSNGRILDAQCFDTNPGTWHKAVVNQIGIAKRSFIIDATYDYEVWNQPVYSYSYQYFNPQTHAVSHNNFRAAAVNIRNFTNDKFKSYRSPEATQIVGVEMKVDYIVETEPTHRTFDNESYDGVTSVVYRYDLELDRRGEVIGGEWYSNAHPDFLWTPQPNARALTDMDKHIEDQIRSGRGDMRWNAGRPLPASWSQSASYNSQAGKPLGLIVEELIKRSRAQ